MELSKIRELDGNMCKACGISFNLEVHHVIFRSRVKNNSENNLITLCNKCHAKVHAYKLKIVDILNRLENKPNFRWATALAYWREKDAIKEAKRFGK